MLRQLLSHAKRHTRPASRFEFFSTTPTIQGQPDKHEFQAETRQLLDIVTNSIYTDKEVFLRELISNASDALEKVRHLQAVGENVLQPEITPGITITTDEEANTLTISDSGIGMSREELVNNLGTIARSGSKAFLESIQNEAPTEKAAAATGIIGKFGVGFYSAFMVGETIDVYTRSAVDSSESHVWRSDGTGSYEISATEDGERGSRIVIHLKDDCKEFCKPKRLESIIKKYSNFVDFPIELNGEVVNTVDALWTKDPKEITEEQYTEFYRYISNAFDEPMYRLNFRADAPIELKTLFFVGSSHMEKHGYSRLESGVSLYSRKVVIERDSPDVLPDWLRFIKGVVDSEDLPLSISRERMQDTRMLAKIKEVLTRRILRFLDEQARKDPEKYNKFFLEFGQFLKEGLCTDFQNKDAIAKLMRYESSAVDKNEVTSLDEYISRCTPDQDKIYFIHAPSRELAEQSPYYEAFKNNNTEVFFVYNTIDDFVMNNIGEFNGRKVLSAEVADVDVDSDKKEEDKASLSSEDAGLLTGWLKLKLENHVKEVKTTSRLANSPALISEHESATSRRMMKMLNEQMGQPDLASKNVLEINPSHPIIIQLNELRQRDEDLAAMIAGQIYDNASMAAGLVDDGRTMLPRLNTLMEKLLESSLSTPAKEN